MNKTEPLLLRINEAAQALGVGRSTIYELTAAGELTTVHIGRAVRIPMRSIRSYSERLEGEQAEAT